MSIFPSSKSEITCVTLNYNLAHNTKFPRNGPESDQKNIIFKFFFFTDLTLSLPVTAGRVMGYAYFKGYFWIFLVVLKSLYYKIRIQHLILIKYDHF